MSDKKVAYSVNVRYNKEAQVKQITDITQGEIVPKQTVTLEQIKELFVEEREHTKELIRVEVKAGVNDLREEMTYQFQSFIENNFEPAMEAIDEKFEHIDDHMDRLDIEVVTLRTDVRQIKRYLRARNGSLSDRC